MVASFRGPMSLRTQHILEAGPGTLQPVSGGKVGRRVADKIIQFLFQFDSGLVSWGQLFNCIEFVSCASGRVSTTISTRQFLATGFARLASDIS